MVSAFVEIGFTAENQERVSQIFFCPQKKSRALPAQNGLHVSNPLETVKDRDFGASAIRDACDC
jgi:hypothetical protein